VGETGRGKGRRGADGEDGAEGVQREISRGDVQGDGRRSVLIRREDRGDVRCHWEAGKRIRLTAEWGRTLDLRI
jgi:hypothetical protein